MISIPWPWQYTISVLANLLAFCAFAVVCLFTNVLIAGAIGMANGWSKFFLQCRTLAMALVIPLAGLGWCLLLLHVGRYFHWFGLSSYGGQLVMNRKCPKTFCEITFAICSILISVSAVIMCMGGALILVMVSDNAGEDPSQVNGTMVAILVLSGLITVFALYVVVSIETGWFGVFPPLVQDQHPHQ